MAGTSGGGNEDNIPHVAMIVVAGLTVLIVMTIILVAVDLWWSGQ